MRSRATQTPSSHYGAELRFHVNGLSKRMASLMVIAAVLCVLNGCSYFLYWRTRYLVTNSFEFHQPSQLAFHTVGAGVFFMFVVDHIVVQTALRIMIDNRSFYDQETRIKRAYMLFVMSMIPVTTGQLLLYSNDWYDSSHSQGTIFIAAVFLNFLIGVSILGYLWASTCADWAQKGVRKAAWAKRNKRLRVWESQLMYIVSTQPNELANQSYLQERQ